MYNTIHDAPSAFITRNKQRVKQFNDTVYLKNNDTFEIELFNPKTTSILAKITIDGKIISGGGLIIRPGERIFLERFVESNNKFKVGTYNIDGNSMKAVNAIRQNGEVVIKFYDEYTPTVTYTSPLYSYTNNTGTPTLNPYTSTNTTLLCDSNTSFTTTCSTNIETAKVEKGGKSNQKFQSSSDCFSFLDFHSITWKILPESRMPYTSGQLRRYCTTCGSRIKKSSFNYCPHCGSKIQ